MTIYFYPGRSELGAVTSVISNGDRRPTLSVQLGPQPGAGTLSIADISDFDAFIDGLLSSRRGFAEALLAWEQRQRQLPQRVPSSVPGPATATPVATPQAGPGTSNLAEELRASLAAAVLASPEYKAEAELSEQAIESGDFSRYTPMEEALEPLPQRVTPCPSCDLYGHHRDCDDAAEADPSRKPCACRQDDHGHYTDHLADEGES